MSGTLHAPRLSFEQAVSVGGALRMAIEHADGNKRKADGDVRAYLTRWVWPECLPDNLHHDYPAVRGDLEGGPDRWARAGFCHGVLDAVAGRGARPFTHEVTRDRHESYLFGYLAGRQVMNKQ